jgi:predicted flap endonuclease-1-like 5' DNA nuclease
MTRLRERIDAAASRLEALDVAVREALERVEGVARAALERAEQPLPLGALERRMNKIEILAQTLRAGVAALRQELAENRRLDEARQARIVSLEERVARAEADPRPAELVLAIDRAEARVIATEREQAAIRERLDALSASAAADRERLDRLASALERALAAFARAPGSAASCAPEPAAAGVRPLRAIPGIGAKIESKLRAAGIGDAAALAALDAVACARLAREIGVKPDKLEAWCAAARAL